MSEATLSIDLSSSPAKLVVARFEGKELRVIESAQVDLNGISFDTSSETKTPQPAQEGMDTTNAVPNESLSFKAKSEPLAEKLKEAVRRFTTPWFQSVVLLPSRDYLSLNLELPFSDDRRISKVLDLEVQDVVPFDVADFVLDHNVLGPTADNRYSVHVGMVPKAEVRNVLDFCKAAEIDPHILCSPLDVLGVPYTLAPHYFEDNSAVLWAEHPHYLLAVAIDGRTRATRLLWSPQRNPLNSEPAPNALSDQEKRALLQGLKLAIAAEERQHSVNLQKIYLFGSAVSASDVQQVVGREITEVSVNELVRGERGANDLATLAACCTESRIAKVGANFRTGEFSYRPQFAELVKGLKALLPHFAVTLGIFLISLICIYFLREGRISKIQSGLAEQITKNIPTLSVTPGQEITRLSTEVAAIEQQLKDLGSLSKLSILDAALELSKDLPKNKEVNIYKLTMKEDQIRIEGSAESYTAIEQIVKALKAKSATYCGVEQRQNTAFGQSKDFEIIVRLC